MFRAHKCFAVTGVLAAVVGAVVLPKMARTERKNWPKEESYVRLGDPETVRLRWAGYNRVMADITWSRMLIYYGAGFLGENDYRYLAKFIYNVIALDPTFKKAYEWAAYSITVTADQKVSTKEEDIRNSIEILERAMAQFPDEYEFFWLAGIRYYLDLKSDDPDVQREYQEKGANLIEQAMRKPNAPKELATTAASLRSKLGQHEQAVANLEQMILTTDDPKAREKMLTHFRGIGSAALADELRQATDTFDELRKMHMPLVPPDMFVILGGPPPSPVIDFSELASTDLFGVGEDEERLVLFRRR